MIVFSPTQKNIYFHLNGGYIECVLYMLDAMFLLFYDNEYCCIDFIIYISLVIQIRPKIKGLPNNRVLSK